eukprot:CAMPEP_0201715102 /NCGR_PEP_ID=MMETSP0593-20130828/1369_1 /ASSEMBLY_ACC=CAM_ASM_000672 /TAXON_ID=267983 /ORGANISM="Skeletonema japonicum, Strain CCMP2506" /LENGTH=669 /DNA_ID=CAMNT_0048204513 /DNA_START=73 /DNA_END=2082 /DNA_ORIENTATION=+
MAAPLTLTSPLTILLASFYCTSCAFSFSPSSVPIASNNNSNNLYRSRSEATLLRAASDDNDNEDDEVILSESEDDWRTFRAKLVMGESSSSSSTTTATTTTTTDSSTDNTIIDDSDLDGIGALFSSETVQSTTTSSLSSGFTPLDPSQWAYDSGKVIEQGAVILGGVEQDFGFGLRQQYFHKAVILVLDHDENTFTKGIILNRPSDRMMEDDVNDGLEWRVWFGGDVQGLDSILPDIVCLHSLKSEEAKEASNQVMKDIQWTSFENAKKLVKKGIASGPEDFWLFAGYAGWGPKQLSGELERRSWYMCATDSQTLLKELARQSSGVDPRDAGLDTWELLMNMIGRGETANECSGNFDDLMLKEWGRGNLLEGYGGDVGVARNPLWGGSAGSFLEKMDGSSVDEKMKEAAEMALTEDVKAGTLLRGSSADRSPFLLQKQELHRSLLLVIAEDDKATVACMLNHPATKGCDPYGKGSTSSLPLRYGGDFALKGQSPLIWLHCSEKLRIAGLGSSLSGQKGVYKCEQDKALEAIAIGQAENSDFLVISGVCVWPKLGGSLANEVKRGVFEVVPNEKVEQVIETLQTQTILTKDNFAKNIQISQDAWEKAVDPRRKTTSDKGTDVVLTTGIGEGFDEDDDTIVFNSDKKVSELADDALQKWIATFLLGAPTLT